MTDIDQCVENQIVKMRKNGVYHMNENGVFVRKDLREEPVTLTKKQLDVVDWVHAKVHKNSNKKRMIWSTDDKNLIEFADKTENTKLDPNDFMRSGWSTQAAKMFDFALFDKSKFTSCELNGEFIEESLPEKEPTFIDPILELLETKNFNIPNDKSFLDQIDEMLKFHLQALIQLRWMEKCLSSFEQ